MNRKKEKSQAGLGIVAGLLDSCVGKIFWICQTLPLLGKKTQSVLK